MATPVPAVASTTKSPFLLAICMVSTKMARITYKIRGIDGSKEMLIIDLWFVETWDKSKQANIVIVDFNGDQIHVVCKKGQLKSWKPILKENCTYKMHNFKIELVDLPLKTHNFIKFGDVISNNFERGLLVVFSTFGIVVSICYHYSDNVYMFSSCQIYGCVIIFIMSNWWLALPAKIICLQFLEYLNECNSEGPTIILLTHAKIKETQGPHPTTISNSLKASKLLIGRIQAEVFYFSFGLI
ncbi:hypothetical protein GmHk_09G025198 [Glycine max]|nr:hypothetical protein GmHk_09G025198 [Glycine max]